MEVESIGQPGNSLNFSYASRAMNIKPDEAQIEKYDHLPLGVTLKWYDSGAVQIAALFLVIALALFYFHYWVWGSVVGLLALFIGYSATLVNLETLYKKEAYESGLLVPGIITSLSPLQVMSFGELRNSLDVPTLYGVRKFTVNSLPHHQLALGEKVPCVALFLGKNNSSYWEDFRPRPVCWGFEDPTSVREQ